MYIYKYFSGELAYLSTYWITIVVNCIGYQSHVAATAEEEYQEQCENQHTSLSMLVTW